MRYLFTLACVLTCLLSACKKSEGLTVYVLDGNYKGTYQKLGPTYQMPQTGNVMLNFSSNKWSGSGDTNGYPNLCNGTFEVKGSVVSFKNACAWAAVVTPGDILDGDFTMTKDGDEITLTQTRGNASNVYKLTKQ